MQHAPLSMPPAVRDRRGRSRPAHTAYIAILIAAAAAVAPTQARAQCGVSTTCDHHVFVPSVGLAGSSPTPTPRPTVTPTSSPTASPPPAPTQVPTVDPPSVQCRDVIVNGGFESGRGVGWLEDSGASEPIIQSAATLPLSPFAGDWSTWFGGYDDAGDVLLTNYTIRHRPADSGRVGDLIGAEFKYVWGMVSNEISSGILDVMGVMLVDESDRNVDYPEIVHAVSNEDPRDSWYRSTVNISQLLTVRPGWSRSRLAIVGVTDSSLRTSWFVDEVQLTICARGELPLVDESPLPRRPGAHTYGDRLVRHGRSAPTAALGTTRHLQPID